ncbi:helix-turn-helix domain-containing protein [Micromonospora sp. NPDC006766]|uniref:helix-turn-helix domain-containing protein n=1 Tax=Micromonospora sp. NPDC006766 TaxID=3154778 RepID=UPI0033F9F6E3
MNTYTAEQITRIGGREWRKSDGTLRVYLNVDVWAPLVGLEIEFYKSGNIAHATLNGEKISNRRAAQLTAIKVYWEASQIFITRDAALGREIREAIAAEVARTKPAPDDDDLTPTGTAAEQVTALRSAGRTVRQIAEMIGVSISTIYRWARGICRPLPANAAALAAIA